MRSLLYVAGAAATVLLAVVPAVPAAADDGGFTIKDPRIKESSGLAASRLHPEIYWTHNDSSDGPYVYAVDSKTGETVARVTMRGVGQPRDVEAISIGPDGDIYVGDIGDNLDGAWDHVWIYRFPEPEQLKDETVQATQYTVKYADGARNAEALMVQPTTGRVYIASKNEKKGGGLYVGPKQLSATKTNVFRRIGHVPWVTDGAFSPDGKQLTLRGYLGAWTYDWKPAGDGGLGAEHELNVPFQGQAESVTYTPDGSALMMGSEGAESRVERFAVPHPKGSEAAKSPSGKDGSASADSNAGGTGSGSSAKWGVAVVAGLCVLFVGAKKVFRRGGGGSRRRG
ncbi:WD40 repeat domain-containing protein [Streptomyces sp. NPDC051322]|uniref:WD40 repeat domain-containing protein n=1 Tax=Streptomyces sp. NPDC051322 TaxID=3154645 RepID=UPI003450202F